MEAVGAAEVPGQSRAMTTETVAAPSWLETAPALAPLYSPSPTADDFIQGMCSGPNEPMRLCLLQGPRGEGKTTCGIYGIIGVAQVLVALGKRSSLPIRVAVVRDTWTNLERTTLVSFEEAAAKGMSIIWREGRKEAIVPPFAHFYFFGLDNRQDCDKLQGFQCGILWLEEVAPAAELATGIPSESLGIGITSVRQPNVPKRVIVTFNPPDEDHWILSVEKYLEEQGQTDILVKKFVMSPGEKAEHFKIMAQKAAFFGDLPRAKEWSDAAKEFEAYRRRNQLALESIGRYDLVDRLVKGKVGGVALGEAIVPGFSHDIHVAKEPILPMQSAQMVRGWDGGLTPSTVWVQVTPAGGIDVLGSITSVGKAMAQHILDEVTEFQKRRDILPPRSMDPDQSQTSWGRGATRGWIFRDIGDPQLASEGDKIMKSEITAGLTIENLLNTNFEPGPIPWSARREALNLAFGRNIGRGPTARPLIRLDPRENKLLIQGLNGRAHYPVDPATGRINESIVAAKRVSGIYLQALDALAYILAVLLPANEFLKRPAPPSANRNVPPPRSWLGM